MQKLNGLTAILTGASDGIGPYIARSLARQQMKLVLAARSVNKLESLADELRAQDVEVEVAPTDVTLDADRRNLPKRARAAFGKIDVLINNAGLEETVPFDKQEENTISKIIETNVSAPILLTREVLPYMLERNQGHVINIASLAGRLGMPYGAVYAGTKAALTEWSLSVAGELSGTGVQMSAICPGFISDSGMFARKESKPHKLLKTAKPEDVANAVTKALKENSVEILVTGTPTRPMVILKAIAPGLFLKVSEKLGITRYLKRLSVSDTTN